MNNEFYEHKRSDAVKWVIVFVLIAVLLGGMVAALVFAVPSADGAEKGGNGDGVTDVSEATEGAVTLSAGIAFTASDPETGAKSVSKTITATVLPVDAPDKSVDWSLTWCVPLEGEDVGDYLSVTPQSDGALTATVTAYKGFEGASAYVTATTRVGGYTASCLVMFEGTPETLSFTYDGEELVTTDSVVLTAGTTNEIALNLSNTLGAVGSKFGDFEITAIRGQGRFVMTKEYIVNGSIASTEEIVFNLEEGSYTYTHEVTKEKETLTITPEKFLTATVEGDILKVNAISSESSYVNGYPRTGYRFTYKSPYTDPRSGGIPDNCRWYVLVEDKVSGVEALLYIDIESTVTSVSLAPSSITF